MKTTKFDIQDYLNNTDDVVYYLEAALAEKDESFLEHAIKDAIKALKRIKKKK